MVNAALLWAQVLVDELQRGGLRNVVIAPGSRSTPLTLAFTANEQIRCRLHLDERSAAFYALGMALASGDPVALVCTSGTAAAEFFPAIIEASQSDVPLLVLTADRPPEQRDSGANQTIDQVKLYGGYLRWQADLALPETDPAPRTMRYLRASAARALAAARGLDGPPGPVHLNLPFRKPLEPADAHQWKATRQMANVDTRTAMTPWTQIQYGLRAPSSDQLDQIAAYLRDSRKGLIVTGPRTPGGRLPAVLLRLAQASGYPILADPLSGLRFSLPPEHPVIGGFTLGLASSLSQSLPQAEIVLRFGGSPTSKPANDYLESLPPTIPQIAVQREGRWLDSGYTTSHLFAVDEAQLCEGLARRLEDINPAGDWLATWRNLDASVQSVLDSIPHCEGQLTRTIFKALPPGTNVVVANSLAIRHVDEFVPASSKALQLYGNRGASGIDGTVSTAIGIAATSEHPTVLLTGDLSFYHDQNGLLALKNQDTKLTIVLINNDGGGIFHRLPVSRFEPPFKDWFVTPHGLDFVHVTRQYGLTYQRCQADEISGKLAAAIEAPESHLLEIQTDAAHNITIHQQILQSIDTKMRTLS